MSMLVLTWKHIPWWFCSSSWQSTSPVSGRAAPAHRRWPGWWRRPCGCRAGTDPLHFQSSLSAEPVWSAHPHLQRDRGALPNAATRATERCSSRWHCLAVQHWHICLQGSLLLARYLQGCSPSPPASNTHGHSYATGVLSSNTYLVTQQFLEV